MTDTFTLLTTLPHHSEMGMFRNPQIAPAWEATHGRRFSTEDLLVTAGELMDRASANQGVEWGDTRSREIDRCRAGFLLNVVDLRTRAK